MTLHPFPPVARPVAARRTLLLASPLLAVAIGLAWPGAQAQSRKDSAVLGMTLEPNSLDPTSAPAAAIGEVVHYNVFEGLTKIGMDGRVTPLLAESWGIDPDGKVYAFKLKRGVKFHDGEAFDASDVKFSFERAKADGSTNKAKKAVFDNISRIDTPDPYTVIMVLNQADGNFLFRMGENTAVILDPKSAATASTQPVGTGPYKLGNWSKGASLTLVKFDGYRTAAQVPLKRVTLRFISDPAAQVAALLAGDVDGMPRFGAPQSLAQFQKDKRYSVDDRRHRGQDPAVDQQQAQTLRRRAGAPGGGCRGRPQGHRRWRNGRPRRTDRQPHGAERRGLHRPDRREPLQPGACEGAAEGGRRHAAAERRVERCRHRSTHARAARSSRPSWPRSASSRRSRTSSGRSGCPAPSRAAST